MQGTAQRDKLPANCIAPPLKKGSHVILIFNIDGTLFYGSIGKVVCFLGDRVFNICHDEKEAESMDLNDVLLESYRKLNQLINKDLVDNSRQVWPLVRFIVPEASQEISYASSRNGRDNCRMGFKSIY